MRKTFVNYFNRIVMIGLMIISGFILNSCVEPYDFVPKEAENYLVVEGFISNISFNTSATYPQDPRYFYIKLRYTNIVSNVRDSMITDASVQLVSDSGTKWIYQLAYLNEEWIYLLEDDQFFAEDQVGYKLMIELNNGELYETDFQTIPEASNPMGELSFTESNRNLLDYIAGELKLVSQNGVELNLSLPQTDNKVNYKWDFFPSYLYIAPNARDNSPYKVCWVTDNLYLREFQLLQRKGVSLNQNLAFILTSANERIMNELTILVRQQILDEESYKFWDEIKAQIETGSLFDPPPYNVRSNIKPIGHDKKAFGYFSVVREDFKRFYLTPADLSYQVEFIITCDGPLPFDANVCINCMAVSNGHPSQDKPSWWR